MEFNRFGMKFDSNDDLLHNEKNPVMMQEPNSNHRVRNDL